MRFALLPATLLAACVMSASSGQAQALSCPDSADALTARLCAALRQEMGARGLDKAGAPVPTLQAETTRPDMLRARLSLGEGAARRDGPELTLSVTDRGTIPDDQLAQMAKLLLDHGFP